MAIHKKLTWEKVDELRGYTNIKTARQLGLMYGIAETYVGLILRHKVWKNENRPLGMIAPLPIIECNPPPIGRQKAARAENRPPLPKNDRPFSRLPEAGNWQRIVNSVKPDEEFNPRLSCPV